MTGQNPGSDPGGATADRVGINKLSERAMNFG